MAQNTTSINAEEALEKCKQMRTCVEVIAERAKSYNNTISGITQTNMTWAKSVAKMATDIAEGLKVIQAETEEAIKNFELLTKDVDEIDSSEGVPSFE